MPAALELVTVNVTGPAGTLFVSSWQPSLPESLASVTLTVFTPFALEVADGLAEWLGLPQALAATAPTATSASRGSQRLGDGDLVPANCTMVLFPFVLFGGSASSPDRSEGKEGGAQRQHRRQPCLP